MGVLREKLSRLGWVRAGVLTVIVLLLLPSAVSALTYSADASLQSGTVTDPANGTTVVSAQGFGGTKAAGENKPARLVGIGPRGDLRWIHTGDRFDVTWFYDVDPIEGGNLLVTGTVDERTVVYSWNPETGDVAWAETFDMHDTHDVDLINGDQLLIANMRNYDEETGKNDDRLVVYDRSEDRIVWEWKFRNHYDRSVGSDYTDDWTHVNDVDKIGPGRYMASPRNFDQVIVVNRSTKEITTRLGSDQNHEVLYAQHNPDYLVSENGTPTVLVADSENDRVVEYAKSGQNWTRTWSLGSSDSLNWPRDADRLPNGNTLVVDTLNHRVFEATPTGEIVWEYYATWGPYDVERVVWGDEPGGPTMRQANATGHYRLSGSAGVNPAAGAGITFSSWVAEAFDGTPVAPQVEWATTRWSHVTPWIRPVWMGSWDFAAAVCAGLIAVGWIVGESRYGDRSLRERLRNADPRQRRGEESSESD